MALTLERSFFCTGDACYLLDDTQPTSESEPGSRKASQLDPPATPPSSSSSLPHAPSPAFRESAPTTPSEPFDLESYLYGVSGIRWRVDEFDWVYGSRIVRATKLDVAESLPDSPGTLQGPISSAGSDRDGAKESGGDRPLQILNAAPPRGRRGNTLSLRLSRYSSVIMKHAPLVFNEVLGMSLDPYRQVRSCPPPSASLWFFQCVGFLLSFGFIRKVLRLIWDCPLCLRTIIFAPFGFSISMTATRVRRLRSL